MRQRVLFDEADGSPARRLPDLVGKEVAELLRQWLVSLAKVIAQEDSDEQDHR